MGWRRILVGIIEHWTHWALSICPTSKGSEILISCVKLHPGPPPSCRPNEDRVQILSKHSPYSITPQPGSHPPLPDMSTETLSAGIFWDDFVWELYMVEGEGWHDLIKEQISAWRYNIISFSENIWEQPDEVPQVVTRFGKLIVTFPIQFLPHWNMKAQLYINHSQKLLPPLGMTLHNINMKLVTAVDFSEKLEGLWSLNSGESPSCWR